MPPPPFRFASSKQEWQRAPPHVVCRPCSTWPRAGQCRARGCLDAALLSPPTDSTLLLLLLADAQHNSYWGEHKYTGPGTSRGKVWAGVGGRPPLMVEVRRGLRACGGWAWSACDGCPMLGASRSGLPVQLPGWSRIRFFFAIDGLALRSCSRVTKKLGVSPCLLLRLFCSGLSV